MERKKNTLKVAKKEPNKRVRAKRSNVMTEARKQEIFDGLINWISNGYSLTSFCKENHVSTETAFQLIDKDEVNTKRYARAREIQAELFFDKIQDVANKRDEDHTPFTGANVIQRDKLIIDSLKWQASKMLPKKYGDKIEVDQKLEHSGSIQVEQITGMRIVSTSEKQENSNS
jgi:hypothetical protein